MPLLEIVKDERWKNPDESSVATNFREALNITHDVDINIFIDSFSVNDVHGVKSPPRIEQ